MSSLSPAPLRFGRFELSLAQRQLLADGQPAPLGGRALDVLVALAEQAGRVVSRSALLDQVWPGIDVEENNLSVQINTLRKTLGPGVIVTVPGRGYQIALPVDAAPAQAEAPAAPAAPLRRTNLPAQLPALIGRDEDLQALAQLLDQQPFITLVGAGGVGKSQLARTLLHARRERHAHGVCFVELAALEDPAGVPAAIAAALGVRMAGGDPPQALARALAPLELLLALDNAEHLLDAVAATVRALQAGAPGVRLLLTSQAPLKLAGEWLFRLEGLSVPPAGGGTEGLLQHGAPALFVARAQAADRRFVVDDSNAGPIAELCRRLDGNALAIELAAARLRQLGAAGLVASLDQRLHLLRDGAGAQARQRTLRAALDWSHGLLSPAEQQVFRRLAVFAGSASLDAVAQVLADDAADAPAGMDQWAVLDALGALVDRSLVDLVPDPASAQPPRYRLLDTPAMYALQCLQAAGEQAAWRQRHARVLGLHFEQAYAELLDGRRGTDGWNAALEPDIENGKAALAWALEHGEAELALAITPALLSVLGGSRHIERLALWAAIEPLLDAPGRADAARARLHGHAALRGAACVLGTQPQHAQRRTEQALACFDAAADLQGRYLALCQLGWLHGMLGDRAALAQVVQAVQALQDAAWSPYVRCLGAHGPLYWACLLDGDAAGALHWNTQGVLLRQAAGWSNPAPLLNRPLCQTAAGDMDGALATSRALVAQLDGGRDQSSLCNALICLTVALLNKAQVPEARSTFARIWPMAPLYGMRSMALLHGAWLAVLEGRPLAGARLLGAADAALRSTGDTRSAIGQDDRVRIGDAARAALATAGGAADFDRLLSEGAVLGGQHITALIFATADA